MVDDDDDDDDEDDEDDDDDDDDETCEEDAWRLEQNTLNILWRSAMPRTS